MATSGDQITIGFSGGQTLSARASAEQVQALRNAIGAPSAAAESTGSAGRWFELQADDGTVKIDTAQVVYLRTESDEHRVGFRA